MSDDGLRELNHQLIIERYYDQKEIERLQKQNKEYQEALQFYANPNIYLSHEGYTFVTTDSGERARRALD